MTTKKKISDCFKENDDFIPFTYDSSIVGITQPPVPDFPLKMNEVRLISDESEANSNDILLDYLFDVEEDDSSYFGDEMNHKEDEEENDNEEEDLSEDEKKLIQKNISKVNQPRFRENHVSELNHVLSNLEAILSYIINAWIFDSMKIVDRGRYALPIYGIVGMVAGYDTWQLNRRQFDKRRQAVLDEAYRRYRHGDRTWLTILLVKVDILDDTNIYNALHISKAKEKIYDPSMDSYVVLFKRINPLASKLTVDSILKKFSSLKEDKQKKYEASLKLRLDDEGNRVKELNGLTRVDIGLQKKKTEFDKREEEFKKRREALVNIKDETKRLSERRKIEKEQEQLQYEEEVLSLERKSTIQRIQEIKPMPEVYHKSSKVWNAIRDWAKPVALKLNKMGPDWRDIYSSIAKVPVDKFFNITFLREKMFSMFSSAVPSNVHHLIVDSLNSFINHIWFIIEPIVSFLEWSTRNALKIMKMFNESRFVQWIEMYYADWTNLYWSIYYNIYGVVPQFFIILYSNFFQTWYHLYIWGNKWLLSNIRRIVSIA